MGISRSKNKMLILASFFIFCTFAQKSAESEPSTETEIFRFFRAHVPFKTKKEKKKSRHNCKMSVPLIVPGGRWETKSGKARLVCGSEARKPLRSSRQFVTE